MTTHCQRCHEPIPPEFRYGRRKYCVPCRNRIAHEQNQAKARRRGYKCQDVRPFWRWFPDYLRESALEMQTENMTPLPVMQIVIPPPRIRRHESQR